MPLLGKKIVVSKDTILPGKEASWRNTEERASRGAAFPHLVRRTGTPPSTEAMVANAMGSRQPPFPGRRNSPRGLGGLGHSIAIRCRTTVQSATPERQDQGSAHENCANPGCRPKPQRRFHHKAADPCARAIPRLKAAIFRADATSTAAGRTCFANCTT